VALSDDDGESWLIKRLPGAYSAHRKMPSVGYCVARQAPNGIIHLVTTLNGPALHFELNEAWILSDATLDDSDPRLDQNSARQVDRVTPHRETYATGEPRVTWTTAVADDGRSVLHGPETWFYPNGAKQRAAEYAFGRKVGHESYWSPDGTLMLEWVHHEDGTSQWTTYWPDGSKRSESTWQNHELVPGSDRFFSK
jgi:hypothetical protein